MRPAYLFERTAELDWDQSKERQSTISARFKVGKSDRKLGAKFKCIKAAVIKCAVLIAKFCGLNFALYVSLVRCCCSSKDASVSFFTLRSFLPTPPIPLFPCFSHAKAAWSMCTHTHTHARIETETPPVGRERRRRRRGRVEQPLSVSWFRSAQVTRRSPTSLHSNWKRLPVILLFNLINNAPRPPGSLVPSRPDWKIQSERLSLSLSLSSFVVFTITMWLRRS